MNGILVSLSEDEKQQKKEVLMTKKEIGIIGGAGDYGQFFWRSLSKHHFRVMWSDLKESEGFSNRDVVAHSEVIILCLPTIQAPKIIKELIPHFKDNQLIIDITSVKSGVTPILESTGASILSIHPLMKAPKGNSFNYGKVVVMRDAIVKPEWSEWVREFFNLLEADLVAVTEYWVHDKYMIPNQNAIHAFLLAYAMFLNQWKYNTSVVMDLTTPVSAKFLGMMARMLKQKPEIYAGIQIVNNDSGFALNQLIANLCVIRDLVNVADENGLVSCIERCRKDLGEEFLNKAETLFNQQS